MAFFEKDFEEASVDCQYLQNGTILFDRFDIIEQIGRGGFGTVYRCRDRAGGHQVAVKVFPAHVARDKLTAGRIHREIRAANSIDDLNVARFFECIRDEELIAIVMEYVEGQTLANICEYQHGLSYQEVAATLLQIARGMKAIHAADIVHRDLKPANILCTPEGTIKITDFGLARGVGDRRSSGGLINLQRVASLDPELTSTSQVVGTPYYLSPEYIQFGLLDQSSDIYSFGVIAYELLSGQLPWNLSNPAELFIHKVEKDPPHLGLILPDCPEALSSLVMRCLRRDQQDRPRSSVEIVQELIKISCSMSDALVRPLKSGIERAEPVKVQRPRRRVRPLRFAARVCRLPFKWIKKFHLAGLLIITGLLASLMFLLILSSQKSGMLRSAFKGQATYRKQRQAIQQFSPKQSKSKVIRIVDDVIEP